jgi:hypothetical protein
VIQSTNLKGVNMTKSQFIEECEARLIDPVLALDSSDALIEALKAKDDAKALEILDNEF